MTSDDGFALIEVLVAFAIVTLGLMSIYAALAGHFKQSAAVHGRQISLAHAQSHLVMVGHSLPAEPGVQTGVYPNGAMWRLAIVELPASVSPRTLPAHPMMLVLDVGGAGARQVLRLKTVHVATAAP
jgi:prepilin-type N-terminal cleavage/methylation domain-containing protein